MKFHKGKIVEWAILRLMDGEWQYWEVFTSDHAARKWWGESRGGYRGAEQFCVVRVEAVKLEMPSSSRRRR